MKLKRRIDPMSYALVRPLAPSRFGRGLHGPGPGYPMPPQLPQSIPGIFGLGTMLDADMFTSAWYLPLIEGINKQTAERGYKWGEMKYLSNWDALSYNMSFTNYGPVVDTSSTLYQWDGSQWRKTTLESPT
jgi:hypothetical protein